MTSPQVLRRELELLRHGWAILDWPDEGPIKVVKASELEDILTEQFGGLLDLDAALELPKEDEADEEVVCGCGYPLFDIARAEAESMGEYDEDNPPEPVWKHRDHSWFWGGDHTADPS